MKRTIAAAVSPAVAAVLLDPARLVLSALLLRKLRRDHPHMFDGRLAAESVAACVAEARADLERNLLQSVPSSQQKDIA